MQDVKNGVYPEPALVRQVLKDGVSFLATPRNNDRIKAAGGSADLVEAIRKLAPAPVPEPVAIVKPVPKGDLEVNCLPIECDVSVDNQPAKTNGGKLLIVSLPEREVTVTVAKEGFATSEFRVRISSERMSIVRTELKPTRATQETWGEQLRVKAVDALGGDAGIDSTRELFAVGDCTVWGSDGKPYSSSFEMLIRPSKAFFRALAGKAGSYGVDYLPTFRSKTNFPEEQARALDAGFRLLNDYQLSRLMNRMRGPAMTLIADSALAEKGKRAEFRAESSTDTFTVSLDKDGRPAELIQRTPLGTGVRAEYSDYSLERNAYVPTRVLVVWPGSPQQGISVHLTTIQLNPSKAIDSGKTVKKRRFWQ